VPAFVFSLSTVFEQKWHSRFEQEWHSALNRNGIAAFNHATVREIALRSAAVEMALKETHP
jgi:hypothetical protein